MKEHRGFESPAQRPRGCSCPEGQGSRCYYRRCEMNPDARAWVGRGGQRPCPVIGCPRYRTERVRVEYGGQSRTVTGCMEHITLLADKKRVALGWRPKGLYGE